MNCWLSVDPERCVKNKGIRLRGSPAAAEKSVQPVNASWWKAHAGELWAVFYVLLQFLFFSLTFRTDSAPCHCSRNRICSDCVVNMYIYITCHCNDFSFITMQKDKCQTHYCTIYTFMHRYVQNYFPVIYCLVNATRCKGATEKLHLK